MKTIRPESIDRSLARRRGVRTAARIAGLLAIFAGAAAQAADGRRASERAADLTRGAAGPEARSDDDPSTDLADTEARLRARSGGCWSPNFWGPPAPPAMTGEVAS